MRMTFYLIVDWDSFIQNLSIPLNYKDWFSEHCFLGTFGFGIPVCWNFVEYLEKNRGLSVFFY